MNSEQKITQLMQSMIVLRDLPVMKLAQNQTLVTELRNIVSSRNLRSVVDDIYNEHQFERMRAANAKKAMMSPESDEFLHLYAQYQSAAHNVLKDTAKSRYTEPLDRQGVKAFNSLYHNPMKKKDIVSLPEAKKFAEAFNSIYSDQSLQIGTYRDPTRITSYIDYSPYIYNYQYYLSIPTLAQTIDLPINMATRMVPKVTFDDHDLSEKIEHHFKRMSFSRSIQKMLLYSALSPRGSLIVPIDDGGKIRFNCFNDTQFTYATSYQYSKIDFQDTGTGVSQLYVLGHLLQNEVTAHFLCPGFEPIFAIGKNRLFQLKDAAEAINIYMYTIKVLCIRAQVLVQKWGGEGQNDSKLAALQKLTSEINSTLSLSTAVNLPADASLDILSSNFSPGFADIAPAIKEFQGMLSGVMPDYFYGSSTAYAANSFNLNVTHQNIRSQIQEAQIEPIYRFAIKSVLERDKSFKQYESEADNFDIDFESLYEPTEMEKLDADAKKIDNIVKMRDYPELEEYFKKEGLLRDEFTLSDLPDREPMEPQT